MTLVKRVLVGSRGSGLALRQTEEVLTKVRDLNPDADFEVVRVKTGGDKASNAPIDTLGVGIFVKEIERALLEGELDMAVHSLKDMPTRLPDGLAIGAIYKRIDARDVLANRFNLPLAQLPKGARIGTSSPRRAAQLRAVRPDLEALPIRGNVDTRLRKAKGEGYDGAILAAAGVIRMGMEGEIAEILPIDDFVPAPGQGALAVEVRQDDYDMQAMVSRVEDASTKKAVTAERAFLEVLGGGCQLPVGAYAQVEQDTMVLRVFLASEDGSQTYKFKVRGRASNPHEVAMDAHLRLVERGAGPLLDEAKT